MLGRIWLIGGTFESGQIAKAMADCQFPCTVTVTTATAANLYPETITIKIEVCQLTLERINEFLIVQKIVAIVDGSHPYAVEVSKMAITAARERNIPYLRYERSALKGLIAQENLIELDSFTTLLAGEYLLNQRVLLTVGYKVLPRFQPWQTRSTLFARILPVVKSLEAALSAGFTPERLIALRPPINAELEIALWRHWGITLVVTKASGTAGGEEIKRAVAAQLKIPLIVIARPKIIYPQQTSELSEVITFCRQVFQNDSIL